MFLESEVLQMYWNQNSTYALAFGRVKYFLFPLLFMCFSKESRDLQERFLKIPDREMNDWILNATFLKCKVLIRWGDMTEKERETKQKHKEMKWLP